MKRDHKPGNAWLALVHRLDYPVGGALLMAKTSKAASRLAEQMRKRSIERRYLCVVEGHLEGEGILEDSLLKDHQKNMTKVVHEKTPHAKEARLVYQSLAYRGGKTLVLVKLISGRSHQIRVQFSDRGYPLLGDRRYGEQKSGTKQKSNQRTILRFGCAIAWEHVTETKSVVVLPKGGLWDPLLDDKESIREKIQRSLGRECWPWNV